MWTRQHKQRNTGRLIIPSLCVLFLSYFGFHAYHGEFGIYSKYRLEARKVELQAQLDAVHPIVAAVCNGAQAAPAVDLSSIQALISTGLPALGHLAGSLPLPPAQQAQVQAALVVAETAAGVVGVVEQQIKAAQPAGAASAGKP